MCYFVNLPRTDIFFPGLPNDDEKTLEEKINLFSEDTFNIKSDMNIPRFETLKKLQYRVLADLIAKNFKGFSFLNNLFSLHNTHAHSESGEAAASNDSSRDAPPNTPPSASAGSSKSATRAHVEKPYFLNEQSTLNMVEILKKMVTRYLELLRNLVDDKIEYDNMLKITHDPKSAVGDRKTSEEYLKNKSRVHGELIVQVHFFLPFFTVSCKKLGVNLFYRFSSNNYD